MNETSARDEIRFIREMIERTRKIAAGSWMFFLIWGMVAILGVAGMYVLVWKEMYTWIWPNWIFFMGIGIVFSVVYGRRFEKRTGAKSYPQIATAHLSIACGTAFMLVGFVFPVLDLYVWGLIPILISMLAGVYAFALSGIYEWNLLKWCALIWWVGAVGMVFVHENYRALFFIPLVLMGYIMPALILRARYQKQREKNAV
jgi:hypothetical protein